MTRILIGAPTARAPWSVHLHLGHAPQVGAPGVGAPCKGAMVRCAGVAVRGARVRRAPPPMRGALAAPTVTHRAALLDKKAFGAMLRAIWTYDGQPETKAALQLLAYLFPRPGELRLAEWHEFDLASELPTWVIPAERTKMRREHRKFLPAQTVAVLSNLAQVTGDGILVFPSVRSRRRAA